VNRKVLFCCFLAASQVLGCSGLTEEVIDLPQKNEFSTHGSSTTKHRVLTVLWRLALVDPDLFSKDQNHHGTPAATRDGGRIFAGGIDGSFICLSTKDGKILWRNLTSGPIESHPTVAGGIVYVGSASGTLYAYRISDGEQLWSYQMPGSVSGQPVLAGDKVLVMTDVNVIVCLEAQTGKWRWSYKRSIPVGRFQVKGVADPLVDGDTVYAGFSDGFLTTLSLEDGSLQHAKKLSGTRDNFTDVDTSPILIDGLLITGSFTQGIIALDTKKLDKRWSFSVEGPSKIESSDGILYFSTANSKVYAIRAKDGKPIWSFSAKKGQLSRPVICGRWLFVSSEEYSLLALDKSSGELVQIFNPGKGANAAPLVHANRIFWTSNGETLYSMAVTQ
jgi:outer membrane protein assembly factor BamB